MNSKRFRLLLPHKRLLLRCFVGAVIALTAALPFQAIHHLATEENETDHHQDDATAASNSSPRTILPTKNHDNILSTPSSSFMTTPIAPCPCNFGPCLTWNTTSSTSNCAMLYPLRWYDKDWDTSTQSLYQRHKRTMHFEVINLRVGDDGETASPTTSCDSSSLSSAYPSLLTYFHIFKNGGTTIRNAFQKHGLSKNLPYKTTEILFTGIQRKIGTDEFHKRLNATVQEIYRGQQQHNPPILHVAPFTFLREPITRFLSGLGQVLNKYKTGKLSKSFPLAVCFADNTNATSQMLDCVLEKMSAMLNDDNQLSIPDDHQYPNQFFDFHLLPQSFLLRDFTGELDIGIMVMSMKENIQPILEMLLLLASKHYYSKQFHARPSRNAVYTGGHDLSSATILTSKQQYSICRLYRMDVELLVQTKVIQDNPCAKMLAI